MADLININSVNDASYSAGCINGETIDDTKSQCKFELLRRLGIVGNNLTITEECVKDVIIGMFFALESGAGWAGHE